jgi:hypothetical protein
MVDSAAFTSGDVSAHYITQARMKRSNKTMTTMTTTLPRRVPLGQSLMKRPAISEVTGKGGGLTPEIEIGSSPSEAWTNLLGAIKAGRGKTEVVNG